MLQIHFSNRFEALAALLLDRLAGRSRGVFAADEVIVPSAAVRRALTLAIAAERGVCANVRFSYLAPWLWQQIRALLPGTTMQPPLDPAALTWRVYAALGDADFVASQPRLAAYLGAADAVMRHELAGRVAALLDQYATYRPDWLDAWRQGRSADPGAGSPCADEDWQAALWRRLCTAPGAALSEALQGLAPAGAAIAGLPAEAHVFALPAMAPLHLDWLVQLGRLIEIHVYVLNPCREYWFELVDRRQLAHLAARGRAQAHEEGNRLLAAWGRQTQSHVEALVDACGDAATDDAVFEAGAADTLLARLQRAILDLGELAPGSVAMSADDRSIEVQVCHSLTREIEVLHQRLLGLIASGAVRHPSEVLVVTPDLDAAAPLIDAVFATAPPDRRIPYTISGRARSSVNLPARALLSLLALGASRFAASEVFGLLALDIVARRFALDDDARQQVHEWLRAAAIRWGLDGAHRAGFGVPATADHSWAEGLDRLFLGYALPAQSGEPFAGMLGAGEIEGSDAIALGAFGDFVERLRALHGALAVARTPLSWRALLLQTLDSFLAPIGDERDDLAELREAIGELVAAMQRGGVGAQPLPLPVLRSALARQLDDPAHGGVPTGGVTFTSMSSLRGLPFAVVCVIGLDDGAFPSARRASEFDLIAQHPRRGDRQRRIDERNLFLDLLLAARHSLNLSYSGKSVRDNAPLPPSVLVAELLDTIVPAIAADPGSPVSLALARSRLVVEHPLQPFAAASFAVDGDPRVRSFDHELADALRRSLRSPRVAPAPTAGDSRADAAADDDEDVDDAGDDGHDGDEDDGIATDVLPVFFGRALAVPAPPWREVSLDQLIEFFRQPCRYLLRRRLGIALVRAEDELQDDEPFVPDWPGRSAFAARLLAPLLAGADAADVRRLAVAGREMPAGALGRRQLEIELEALVRFADRIRAATAAPCLPPHPVGLEFDLGGERWRLDAAFSDLREQGLVRWRCDDLRPVDILAAWLPHLILCAAPPGGVMTQTRWLARDRTLQLATVPDPRSLLAGLLQLYRRGLREPLEFYPKSAWRYVESGASLAAAGRVWSPTRDRPFAEGADPAYRLALRGRGDALAGEFAALAVSVFGPVADAIGVAR